MIRRCAPGNRNGFGRADHLFVYMDYADAGVDIDASDSAVEALAGELGIYAGDYAGVMELGGLAVGLTTDGVGTKILVAEAVGDYSTIGIDCVAMNANDLIAMGLEPRAFVDYVVVEEPDDDVAAQLGEGLREGAERAGAAVLGGETAVMPEVVSGVDLAGTCMGTADPDEVIDGTAVEPGDALVGFPSSGVHSNGLTLARKAVTRRHDYGDELPYDGRTIGEELLEPTRIYTEALAAAQQHDVHGMAHVTGGGFTNLGRIADHRFVVDDPLPIPPIFDFVKEEGDVSEEEMHRTFNMGTGFVIAAAPDAAEAIASGTDASVIGRVEEGDGVVVRGLEL